MTKAVGTVGSTPAPPKPRSSGPFGSRILADVFIGLLDADNHSFLRQPNWKPTLPADNPGLFTMADLPRFMGDLDHVNEPATFWRTPEIGLS